MEVGREEVESDYVFTPAGYVVGIGSFCMVLLSSPSFLAISENIRREDI